MDDNERLCGVEISLPLKKSLPQVGLFSTVFQAYQDDGWVIMKR